MAEYYLQLIENQLPAVTNPERARVGLERLREAALETEDPALRQAVLTLTEAPEARRVIESVAAHSPFLTECLVLDPGFAVRLLTAGPDSALAEIAADLKSWHAGLPDVPIMARHLRGAKRRVALTVALADIANLWPLERITGALSDFAEGALDALCARLLKDAERIGALQLAHPDDPARNSGLIVLGMGKLGARELNYSSDIDLIILYDNEIILTDDPDALQATFVRLARNLVKAMEERTADGYVFRTDLRLRPDPGSTPLALSTLAAELYYESLGQNWERAAMIKARPVAGDRAAGQAFLDRLRPYVWRKNLDFAAIQDIHSIKRQIHAHKGGGKIAVAGHNLKLGRGGIREIEFYAQTQQLIWGGRIPKLRHRATCDALRGLAEHGQISATIAEELIDSYGFLRRAEHRLQMIDDKQTQTLPGDNAGLNEIAAFLGFADRDAFAEALVFHLRRVETYYADLFEDSPELGSSSGEDGGNLAFTGADSDPETLATIGKMGFTNAQGVDATIRGWHHGRYRAMRSTRARELLTELTPTLLGALGRTAEPDAAFMKFDEFLSRLPGGVQLFSLFYANPQMIELVAELMGGAPRLAEHLSRHPALLEAMLTRDILALPPSADELDEDLDRHLAMGRDYQDRLDAARRWTNEYRFRIGVQTLRALIDADTAALAYSDVAETALSRLQPHVEDDFARTHGRIKDGGMVTLALGKLGSREMTPTSDLDLIIVYDHARDCEASDGARPLPPSQYYGRLTQRFINAVTAPSGEGVLYEVDMRLRPSGSKGPIATSLESFLAYQAQSAWTWEHMALTRARVVAGDERLRATIEQAIREVLARRRDPERLLLDVADMRRRMDQEHHTNFIWDMKHRRGGLVDIEFIAQYLQLRHAHKHPGVLCPRTAEALGRLRDAGLLAPDCAKSLIDALGLWQSLQGMLRLTIEGFFKPEREGELSDGLKQVLVRATGASRFDVLMRRMDVAARSALDYYQSLIEEPAARLRPQPEGQ